MHDESAVAAQTDMKATFLFGLAGFRGISLTATDGLAGSECPHLHHSIGLSARDRRWPASPVSGRAVWANPRRGISVAVRQQSF